LIQPPLRTLKRLWGIVVAVGVVVGLIAFFKPDVVITPQPALDPHDPFSALLVVTNNGALAIEDGQSLCHVRYMEDRNRNSFSNANRFESSQNFAELSSKDSTTIKCLIPVDNDTQWTKADIELWISFRPSFWPGRMIKRSRFVAIHDINAGVRWTPLALDSK
jgi:hypothetical protein